MTVSIPSRGHVRSRSLDDAQRRMGDSFRAGGDISTDPISGNGPRGIAMSERAMGFGYNVGGRTPISRHY